MQDYYRISSRQVTTKRALIPLSGCTRDQKIKNDSQVTSGSLWIGMGTLVDTRYLFEFAV